MATPSDIRGRVLILTHFFPPWGGGGSLRVAKFAKYLPLFGWKPVILTLNDKYVPKTAYDRELLTELPSEVTIYRTSSFTPKDDNLEAFYQSIDGWKMRSLLRKAVHLASELLLIPDRNILWLLYALVKVYSISRSNDIDVIMASSPPHSTQVIGTLFSWLFNVPLVSDFRDDWIGHKYLERDLVIRKMAESKLESLVVGKASRIIVPTKRSVEWLKKRYAKEKADKFLYIPNGYDPEDFSERGGSSRANERKFVISYIGQFYKLQADPLHFLTAVKGILAVGILNPDEIEITIVGRISERNKRLIRELGLQDILSIKGQIPHTLCLKYLTGATIGLIIQSREEGVNNIAQKAYEYMAAGLPILAVTDEGALKDLITGTKTGLAAKYGDTAAIRERLEDFVSMWRKGELNKSFDCRHIDAFSRKNLTGELANVLTAVRRGPREGRVQ